MRAAIFYRAGQPLSIETVADPRPAAGEVVLQVARAGICGSDLHMTEYPDVMPPGLIMGHEFSGSVVALGAGVGGPWRVGQRVTALPLHVCHHCEACDGGHHALCPSVVFAGTSLDHPGAYAEYVRVPADMLQALPDGVGFDEGAMIEPLSVGYHAVRLAESVKGASVLVLGAGPIGAAVTLFARMAGARHVVVSERFPKRRERAIEVGATAVVDPVEQDPAEAFARLTGGNPQVVFECVGVPGMLREAVRLVGIRGRIVVAGVVLQDDSFSPLPALLKEVSIRYSQAYDESDFEAVIRAIASGDARPQPLHTATVSLDQLPETFESLRSASPHCKVLIDPSLA